MNKIVPLLKNELKIPPKSTLILSVSGGVDSMVMLSTLQNSPYKIVVTHFNHLKRDASNIEKDLLENYCLQNEIPFHYYTISIKSGNFHHQAHQMRMHYLNEVARIHKTPYILTAHHLDDLLENVLIKLTRGSNLLGYAGMQMIHNDQQYIYIKPLLYTSKQDILNYAHVNKIPFLDDESNEENNYLRNRYRHAIVPIMKQENEQLLDQIKLYHNQITNAFEFIRKTTQSLLNTDMIIQLDQYRAYDEAIKDDMIAYMIENHALPLTNEGIQKIKKMLLSSKPNQIIKLNKDYALIKAYNKAYIKKISSIKPVKIKIKEGINKLINMAIFTFSLKSEANTEDFIKLCYNKLAFPLWIRHREDGDLLNFEYGHKKLKKLFIDLKIPNEERQKLWVLTDNDNHILWVEKYYINQTLGDSNTLYFQLKEVK